MSATKFGTDAVRSAYQQMAVEEAREAEALAWAEATIADVANEVVRGGVADVRRRPDGAHALVVQERPEGEASR